MDLMFYVKGALEVEKCQRVLIVRQGLGIVPDTV